MPGLLRHGHRGDPINIGALERFIGDWALRTWTKWSSTWPNGAVGPHLACGLNALPEPPAGPRRKWPSSAPVPRSTVAHFLGGQGYAVTVFDGCPLPGGVISYGIPESSAADVIDAEAKRIERLGVEFRYGVVVGRDVRTNCSNKATKRSSSAWAPTGRRS